MSRANDLAFEVIPSRRSGKLQENTQTCLKAAYAKQYLLFLPEMFEYERRCFAFSEQSNEAQAGLLSPRWNEHLGSTITTRTSPPLLSASSVCSICVSHFHRLGFLWPRHTLSILSFLQHLSSTLYRPLILFLFASSAAVCPSVVFH